MAIEFHNLKISLVKSTSRVRALVLYRAVEQVRHQVLFQLLLERGQKLCFSQESSFLLRMFDAVDTTIVEWSVWAM